MRAVSRPIAQRHQPGRTIVPGVTSEHIGQKIRGLTDLAARAVAADPSRAEMLTAINQALAEPGCYPRSLYEGPARRDLLAALAMVATEHAWRAPDEDEIRVAPRGGFRPSAPGRQRPDPWCWVPRRQTASVACSGPRPHTVVWERGELSTPSHPDPEPGTRCRDVLEGRRVPKRFDNLRRAADLISFGPDWFACHGLDAVRVGSVSGRVEFDLTRELHPRFEERFAWWDTDAHDFGPVLDHADIQVHDPQRPDLTDVRVHAGPPARDAWPGWRETRLKLSLSTWWELEVLSRPWEKVEGLTTLEVLAWDLEAAVPTRVLLLDWADDPQCPGIVLPGDRRSEREISHEFDNVLPVLVRAEVAADLGATWRILDAERSLVLPI